MGLRSNRKYLALLGATTVSKLGDGASSVAYPWLASAVTRNPLLVALVAVAQRLPWLVFSLPAGVITDRVDRRRAIVLTDSLQFAFTTIVAFAVLSQQHLLPGPGHTKSVIGTRTLLYLVVLLATLAMGMASVLRDNCGQTLTPSIVDADDLEKANGRMWGVEGVMETFVGPPLGALLLGVAFCLPFFIDAASFFAGAALIFTIPGTFRAIPKPTLEGEASSPSWRAELREGVRWLWHHDLLRPMAIILGLMNLGANVSGATMVLFAQEVMHTSPFVFAILGFGGAIGGLLGGQLASAAAARFGAGTCLAAVLLSEALFSLLIGVVAKWPAVIVFFGLQSMVGILWNVITVSLRQRIIPGHLLGRVNSVYRFFAWGMMPIGAAVGGITVLVVDTFASRSIALRATWLVCSAIHVLLFAFGRRKLTTRRIEEARAVAVVAS